MRLCRKFPLPSHPLGTSAPLPWQRTSPLPSPLCPCCPPASLVTSSCQLPASTAGGHRRADAYGRDGSATSSHQRTTFQWLDGATAKTYYCTPVVATTVITTCGGGTNLPRPAGSPPSACTRADPRRPVSIVGDFFSAVVHSRRSRPRRPSPRRAPYDAWPRTLPLPYRLQLCRARRTRPLG